MKCYNFLVFIVLTSVQVIFGSAVKVSPLPDSKLHYFVAPYQVAIRWVNPSPNAPVTNLCNGVIVSKDYILTTARCLHRAAPWPPGEMITISASQLYIVAGNFSLTSNEHGYNRNVISVIIHDQFDTITNRNDVALLRLDGSLPLTGELFDSISWIELQQVPTYGNCYTVPQANINSTLYPYYKQPNATISEYWNCSQTEPTYDSELDGPYELLYTTASIGKLCLQYTTQNRFLCNATETLLQYSIERGTGLICDERIAGLLSEIHQPANPAFCENTGKTFASYTNITEHFDWIRTKASLYFYNSTDPGYNSTLPVIPPSWTWNQNTSSSKPGKNAAPGRSIPVMTICFGLVLAIAIQVGLVNLFVSN